jgi:hypothetical protein
MLRLVDLGARVSDTRPSDDERWSAALAQVARRAPRTEEAVRRGPRQLTWLSTVVGVLAVLSLVLLVLQLLGGGPSWRQTLAWVAAVSLVVLCLVGAVLAWSGGTLRNSWQDVQRELTRAQRRHVAGQLRGRVPVDPAHVPLVREWAWHQAGQVPLVLLAVGVQQGRMGDLHDRDAFFHRFGVGMLVVWLVLLGRTAVELRRVRRFVHAHPEPPRG